VLVNAGVYGTIFSLISGLDIPVYPFALLAAIFISSLCFYAIYSIHGLMKYGMVFFWPIYLAAGYLFRIEITNGFWHLENIYISKYNSYYNTNVLKYLVENYNEKEVLTIFFIFTAILLSQLFCQLILKNNFRILFMIVTVPIVLLSFTVGYIPKPAPFGIYLACSISILGMGVTLREKHRRFPVKIIHKKHKNENKLLEQNFKYVIGLKIGGFLSVLLLALFLVISIIFTRDFYNRKFDVTAAKNKIQEKMMAFNLKDAINNISSIQLNGLDLFQGVTASGGLSGGKLGRIGEVNFNYRTALRIKTPVMGTNLYLKGYVGSEYKGNYWDSLSRTDLETYEKIAVLWEDSDFTIGNQSSYFLSLIMELRGAAYDDFGFSFSQIEVNEVNSGSGYIYAPYYSEYTPDTLMEAENPEYVTPKKKQVSYLLGYYENYNNLFQFDAEENYVTFLKHSLITGYDNKDGSGILNRMEEYRTYEEAYRNYVYDIYTRVPETGLENLKKEFNNVKYDEYKEQYGVNALDMIIDMVRDNLNRNTAYSLTPGTLPRGKDFVEYFLYENQTGYCSHYASAAAMIFRTIGIPARYVEGYIVKPADMFKGTDGAPVPVMEYRNGMINNYYQNVRTIDIPDANAHAWVEIYVDGFGWVPVEVTPGFTGSSNLTGNSDSPAVERNNELTPSPSPTEAPKEEVNPSDSVDKAEDSAEDKEDTGEEKKEGETVSGVSGKESSAGLLYLKKIAGIILFSVALAAGIVLFLFLRAFWIMSKRENAQRTKDFSKRVLLRYNEINRILDYYRIRMNEDLSFQEAAVQIEKDWNLIRPGRFKRFADIVLKARFGQHCITREEAKEAEEFYKELVNSVYKNTGTGKRIILRFIKVFY